MNSSFTISFCSAIIARTVLIPRCYLRTFLILSRILYQTFRKFLMFTFLPHAQMTPASVKVSGKSVRTAFSCHCRTKV